MIILSVAQLTLAEMLGINQICDNYSLHYYYVYDWTHVIRLLPRYWASVKL